MGARARRDLAAAAAVGGALSLAALLLGQSLVVPGDHRDAASGVAVVAAGSPGSPDRADTTTRLPPTRPRG